MKKQKNKSHSLKQLEGLGGVRERERERENSNLKTLILKVSSIRSTERERERKKKVDKGAARKATKRKCETVVGCSALSCPAESKGRPGSVWVGWVSAGSALLLELHQSSYLNSWASLPPGLT